MSKRSYGEMCPVARALDVIGERWTILIVRELLLGPKRFKDLLARLPAMGTNRLADRLKGLEAAGVLAKRTLPAPAEVQVYELSDYGERLRHEHGAGGADRARAVDHRAPRAQRRARGDLRAARRARVLPRTRCRG